MNNNNDILKKCDVNKGSLTFTNNKVIQPPTADSQHKNYLIYPTRNHLKIIFTIKDSPFFINCNTHSYVQRIDYIKEPTS